MTTIQDRIIEKYRKNFRNIIQLASGVEGGSMSTSNIHFIDKEVEQFLIQSIKIVQEETRKEILKVIKENHTIEVNNHSDLHLIGNFSGLKHNLSITNKEKQK